MSSHYGYGKHKELQVAEFLERRGFKWDRTPASRGPLDLIAAKGRLHLAIQVKATRSDFTRYTRLSRRDETRILRSAAVRRARPTLALVSRNYLWLVSVPDEILIKEGELRLLRYEYPEET
jgi:Holliday junction resolvase